MTSMYMSSVCHLFLTALMKIIEIAIKCLSSKVFISGNLSQTLSYKQFKTWGSFALCTLLIN